MVGQGIINSACTCSWTFHQAVPSSRPHTPDSLSTHHQNIGRFHHFLTPSHTSHKISAPLAILIRIFDFSSKPIDIIPPTIALFYELHLLKYPTSAIRGTLTRANRSRPHPIWTSLFQLLISLSKFI